MKSTCTWNQKMQFQSSMGAHQVLMDAKAPIGADSAPTPKDLLLAALCGCSAMDVVALLKKYREPLESFAIEAEAKVKAATPAVFEEAHLTYRFSGPMNREKVSEAVRLSETKYCSVGAMVSLVVPVYYTIVLNGEEIARGQASFAEALQGPAGA